MTVFQLTISRRGVLVNFYFNGKTDADVAREHAAAEGCIFLFGEAGQDLDVPFGSIDSPIDFMNWLRNTRQGA